MGRDKNNVETKVLTVSTTPQIVADLEELVSTGYYGKTAAEAADRVIAASLKKIVLDEEFNRLKRRKRR